MLHYVWSPNISINVVSRLSPFFSVTFFLCYHVNAVFAWKHNHMIPSLRITWFLRFPYVLFNQGYILVLYKIELLLFFVLLLKLWESLLGHLQASYIRCLRSSIMKWFFQEPTRRWSSNTIEEKPTVLRSLVKSHFHSYRSCTTLSNSLLINRYPTWNQFIQHEYICEKSLLF